MSVTKPETELFYWSSSSLLRRGPWQRVCHASRVHTGLSRIRLLMTLAVPFYAMSSCILCMHPPGGARLPLCIKQEPIMA